MIFRIEGKLKPYVRMTRRGKWVSPEAQEYLASTFKIVWQFKEQMAMYDYEMWPAQTPLAVNIHIEMASALHRSDLDNQVKAILDAAQGIVFLNDCWIDKIVATRGIGEDFITIFRVGVISV